MSFYTVEFLLFFPIVLLLYSITPGKYRWLTLLIASYYFYMSWEPAYASFMAASTVVDFFCGHRIGKSKSTDERRNFLLLSIFVNLGLLMGFKYLDFFNATLKTVLQPFNILYDVPALNIVAPVGISYYTFKKLSYIINVYRENREPAVHLGKFALYVSFFPSIAAGPIDRPTILLTQFDGVHTFDYDRVSSGLKLMAWGMFKKVVIADRLAIFVDTVYNHPHDHQGLSLAVATIFFSIQIYADFSGYTDIAIGMSHAMGFDLMDNFNRPYSAVSIREFWRRWHISLATWLRDYLFLPTAYSVSRRVQREKLLNIKSESWAYSTGILLTMLLCGLWHGASWTFVVWGGLHGLLLIISFATSKFRKKWRKMIVGNRPRLKTAYKGMRILITFLVVSFLWIFFRARSLSDALYIISHLFRPELPGADVLLGMDLEFAIAMGAVGFMLLVHMLQPHHGIRRIFSQKPLLFRWVFYVVLVLAIMNLGKFNEIPFIYVLF